MSQKNMGKKISPHLPVFSSQTQQAGRQHISDFEKWAINVVWPTTQPWFSISANLNNGRRWRISGTIWTIKKRIWDRCAAVKLRKIVENCAEVPLLQLIISDIHLSLDCYLHFHQMRQRLFLNCIVNQDTLQCNCIDRCNCSALDRNGASLAVQYWLCHTVH